MRMRRCHGYVQKMENYEVVKELGTGVQGITYLVKHKLTNQFYALKMIECLDESHANTAFREYIELQDIGSHHLLCDLYEFFVHWDRELSSMFFCVVTSYYPRGDLGTYLATLSKRNQVLDESTIRIWVGEIVQALVFANQKNICHRDLKPSNVYLRDSGSHIIVGDFCVSSILRDVRTRTRMVAGSRHYCAPELAELMTSDDRADMWALGCMVLSLMVAGIRGTGDMPAKLDDIKYSRTALEEVLVLTEEFFSDTLQSFVRRVLNIDPKYRPSLTDVAALQFIVDSMNEANVSRIADQQLDYPYKSLPTTDSMLVYVKYILENLGNELCVGDAFDHLLKNVKEHTGGPYIFDMAKKKIIIKAMSLHLPIERITTVALQLVTTQLTGTVDPSDYLLSPEALDVCISAIRRHPMLPDVLNPANIWLTAAATSEKAVEMMLGAKVCADILQIMHNLSADPVVCSNCMNTLWAMMATGNIRYMAEQKVVTTVVEIIKLHKANPELLQSAFCLILGLTLQDENIRLIKSSGCIDLILETLNTFNLMPMLIKDCCLALTAIVEADEESAYYMLTEQANDRNFISDVIDIYSSHRHNAIVVSSICTLFVELSHYEDVASEMEHMKIDEKMLKSVRKKFKDDPDIMSKSNKIISNMRNVKPLIPVPKPLLKVS